jgi:hypothetical protein
MLKQSLLDLSLQTPIFDKEPRFALHSSEPSVMFQTGMHESQSIVNIMGRYERVYNLEELESITKSDRLSSGHLVHAHLFSINITREVNVRETIS